MYQKWPGGRNLNLPISFFLSKKPKYEIRRLSVHSELICSLPGVLIRVAFSAGALTPGEGLRKASTSHAEKETTALYFVVAQGSWPQHMTHRRRSLLLFVCFETSFCYIALVGFELMIPLLQPLE